MKQDTPKSRRIFSHNLQNGNWKLRHAIGGTHKQQYYHKLLCCFDGKNKQVFNWFVCAECRMLIFANLSKGGTKKLHAHPCVARFEAEMVQSDDDMNGDGNVSDDDIESDDEGSLFERDDDGKIYIPQHVIQIPQHTTSDEEDFAGFESGDGEEKCDEGEESTPENSVNVLSEQIVDKSTPELSVNVISELSNLMAKCGASEREHIPVNQC